MGGTIGTGGAATGAGPTGIWAAAAAARCASTTLCNHVCACKGISVVGSPTIINSCSLSTPAGGIILTSGTEEKVTHLPPPRTGDTHRLTADASIPLSISVL